MEKIKCKCGREYGLVPLNHPLMTASRMLGQQGEPTQFDAQALSWRGDNADTLTRQSDQELASRTVEAPARAASIESDVRVPLYQSVIGGVFVGAAVTCAWWALGWRRPILGPVIVTSASAAFFWHNAIGEMRSLLWRLEKWTGKDIDKDGAVGEPPEKEAVYSPFPINGRDKAKSNATPEPAAKPAAKPAAPKSTRPTKNSLIQIRAATGRKSARVVTLGELWGFMLLSFERNSWGRDAWQNRGVSQQLWADYKTFLESFGWWKADRPTLDLALSRFCYPSTNKQENKQTNDEN